MAETKPSATPTPTQGLQITAADLQTIISTAVAAAVAEAKKPTELEQEELEHKKELRDAEKLRVEADNQSRLETSAQQKQQLENRKRVQETCLHEGGKPTHSHAVFVHDPLGGYVLCQVCQATIRPTSQRAHFKSANANAIFDDRLFQTLFQKTNTSGIFG
jgi:hypothetical protein